MKVTHYYAGCRVDNVPVITENRTIDTATPTVRPIIQNRRTIKAFCSLLAKYGLLGDYIMRYLRGNNELSLKDFFQETHPEYWSLIGISWEARVYDYFYLSMEWGEICKKNK